jgi:hypothetical protein
MMEKEFKKNFPCGGASITEIVDSWKLSELDVTPRFFFEKLSSTLDVDFLRKVVSLQSKGKIST